MRVRVRVRARARAKVRGRARVRGRVHHVLRSEPLVALVTGGGHGGRPSLGRVRVRARGEGLGLVVRANRVRARVVANASP